MNKDKLKAFRDWFAAQDTKYNQEHWCQCVAAHVARWEGGIPASLYNHETLITVFGVSKSIAARMYGHPTHWRPSKDDALAMLDRLIETGKVEWPE